MSSNRFNEIVRNLHFCDNEARATITDKAWKGRTVIQALQKTFLRAWTMTARFSFDEGGLPSISSRSLMRA